MTNFRQSDLLRTFQTRQHCKCKDRQPQEVAKAMMRKKLDRIHRNQRLKAEVKQMTIQKTSKSGR